VHHSNLPFTTLLYEEIDRRRGKYSKLEEEYPGAMIPALNPHFDPGILLHIVLGGVAGW
jgi:hypothetical protein